MLVVLRRAIYFFFLLSQPTIWTQFACEKSTIQGINLNLPWPK